MTHGIHGISPPEPVPNQEKILMRHHPRRLDLDCDSLIHYSDDVDLVKAVNL